jgi:hypothetical protein
MLREDAKRYIERQMPKYYLFDMNDLIDNYLSDERELQETLDRVKCKQFAKILKEKAKLNIVTISFNEFYNLFAIENDIEHNSETENGVKEVIAVEESAAESSETENSAEHNPETENIVKDVIAVEEKESAAESAEYNPETEDGVKDVIAVEESAAENIETENSAECNPETKDVVKDVIAVEESSAENSETENSAECNPETKDVVKDMIAIEESATENSEIENQENNKE